MAPKPDVSAERKQQIFRAALTCFGRQGFHLTTMDDIVEESGLSKGALYWYFDSKKALFLALFQEMMGQMAQSWQTIAADESTCASDKLRASMALFRSELEELVPFFRVMIEAWALTRHDEEVEALIRDFYRPYLEIMLQIIQQGVSGGEFFVASPEAMALVVMTLYDGLALAIATGLWTRDWGEITDAAEALVLNGLGVACD